MRYRELFKLLESDIVGGKYSKENKLPTEDEIMNQYQVSRYCVRQAIDLLVDEGEVYPVQGSGMYVRNSKRGNSILLNSTKGLTAEFGDNKISTRVVSLKEVQANKVLARRMKCKPGTKLFYVVRLRKIANKPFAVEYDYLNKEIIPKLNCKIARGSVFSYVKKNLGLNIVLPTKFYVAIS